MIIIYILGGIIAIFLMYILFLFVCSLFVRTDRQYTEDSRFYRHLLYGATGFAMWFLRVKMHVTGMEKIPVDVKPLFVGNHLSNYDPLIEWHVFKKWDVIALTHIIQLNIKSLYWHEFKKWDVAFVSKPENFKIPIFGRIIRRCCFMPIDRSDPGKALSTIKTATEILQKGDMAVGVYPEGTRNRQGGLLPFHTGVFRIAQKAHAPIVVMAIHGTENIYRNVLRRRSDVYIDVVDVIPADEVKAMKKNEISDRVRLVLEKDEKGKNYGKEVHFI